MAIVILTCPRSNRQLHLTLVVAVIVWMALFAHVGHAADIALPYWGDRSCWDPDRYCGDFPEFQVRYWNPITGASIDETLRFMSGPAAIEYRPEETLAYRTTSGCITCDAYRGVLIPELYNLSSDSGANERVFPAFGFNTDWDYGETTMVFDGVRLALMESVWWDGWMRTAAGDYLHSGLWMKADHTWEHWSELSATAQNIGTWRELHAPNAVAEPRSLYLLLPGLVLLYLKTRANLTHNGGRFRHSLTRTRPQ